MLFALFRQNNIKIPKNCKKTVDKQGLPIYNKQVIPIIKGGIKVAVGKKRGPKTDNPKAYRMTIKLDQESKDIIEAYCAKESVSKGECVRRGVKQLKGDL